LLDDRAMPTAIEIEGRFNGPLDSGNGGYCSGVLAGLLGGGPAEVSLRSAVPLDTPLTVVGADDGSLRASAGEESIADARPAPGFEVDVPDPVGVEDARAATAGYRGRSDGPFCRCFVCGQRRADALGVFAGAVHGRPLVASPWTPPAWTADADGDVRPEIVWAVLDCPTYFATYIDVVGELPLGVLARQTASVGGSVRAGEEHVVIGWGIGVDGRKRHAGSAVLAAGGDVLAAAEVLLIEPRA
jgi:hypothetical protein